MKPALNDLAAWFRKFEIEGLQSVIFVIDEDHAATKLISADPGINLIVAVPSFTVPAMQDVDYNTQVIYMFALGKISDKERCESEEFSLLEKAGAVITRIITEIKNAYGSGDSLFFRLQGEIEIEPVYNKFGGWDGYSCIVTV